MRQPRKYSVGSPTGNYTVSFSSSLRPPEGRDGVYDDVRPNEGSFSNLSSPQPIYSSVLSDPGSINDFSLGRVQQPRSFRPRPQPCLLYTSIPDPTDNSTHLHNPTSFDMGFTSLGLVPSFC